MTGFGKSMTTAGKTMTTRMTMPIVLMGGAILKVAADFEKSMNRVAALSGATGEDFDKLRKQAKQLGITTEFSASQAADAMGFLAMAGFDATEIYKAMPSTLRLASAAQLDIGRSADIVSNILTGYRMTTEELENAVDVLTKAFTSSNVDLEMLSETMKYVAPVASGLGMDFEEVTAAIGMLGSAGIQGSMAGTALRSALADMADPMSALNSTALGLGLSFRDVNDNVLPLVDILKQMEDKGIKASDVMALFGKRAGPSMLALLGQGSEALAAFTSNLEKSGGIAEKISEQQMKGLHGELKKLRSAAEGFAIMIADSGLLEWATQAIGKLTGFIQKLSETSPALLKLITVIILVAAALGPLIAVIGFVITSIGTIIGVVSSAIAIIGSLTAAFVAVVPAIGAILAVSAPFLVFFGALALALIGVGAAVYEIIKHWDEIKFFFSDFKANMETVLKYIYDSIKFWLVDKFQGVIDSIKEKLNIIKVAWQFLSDTLIGHSIIPEMHRMIEDETQRHLDQMLSLNWDEKQRLIETYNEYNEKLNNSYAAGLITKTEYLNANLETDRWYAQQEIEIAERTWREKHQLIITSSKISADLMTEATKRLVRGQAVGSEQLIKWAKQAAGQALISKGTAGAAEGAMELAAALYRAAATYGADTAGIAPAGYHIAQSLAAIAVGTKLAAGGGGGGGGGGKPSSGGGGSPKGGGKDKTSKIPGKDTMESKPMRRQRAIIHVDDDLLLSGMQVKKIMETAADNTEYGTSVIEITSN